MPGTAYIFVGPYAEWLVPQQARFPEAGQADLESEDRDSSQPDLLEDGRLFWNISYLSADPPRVEQGGQTLYQYCCGPLEPRPGAGRSPMLFRFGERFDDASHLEFAVVDLLQDDRKAEVRWFREAFSDELGFLESRVFGAPPQFGWGLIGMWS